MNLLRKLRKNFITHLLSWTSRKDYSTLLFELDKLIIDFVVLKIAHDFLSARIIRLRSLIEYLYLLLHQSLYISHYLNLLYQSYSFFKTAIPFAIFLRPTSSKITEIVLSSASITSPSPNLLCLTLSPDLRSSPPAATFLVCALE